MLIRKGLPGHGRGRHPLVGRPLVGGPLVGRPLVGRPLVGRPLVGRSRQTSTATIVGLHFFSLDHFDLSLLFWCNNKYLSLWTTPEPGYCAHS